MTTHLRRTVAKLKATVFCVVYVIKLGRRLRICTNTQLNIDGTSMSNWWSLPLDAAR